MTHRSSRHGWTLVVMRDDRWRIVEKGDRDPLKERAQELTCEIVRKPGLRQPGEAVGLYDANGVIRSKYPTLPYRSDNLRVAWPATPPNDGDPTELAPIRARPIP